MKKGINSSNIVKSIVFIFVVATIFCTANKRIYADDVAYMDNYGEIEVEEDEYIENPDEEIEDEEGNLDLFENLPSSYGNTSKIAYDQGSSRTCWAFAGTSLFELKVDKENNISNTFLSVEHLVEKVSIVGNCGFTATEKEGGNYPLYSAYFISGYGPVNGIDYPWGDPDALIENYDFGQPEYRATSIRYIARDKDKDNTWDENTINIAKEEIISNGGITCSLYWNVKYFNATESSYYAYDKGLSTTHQVVIVGWDDTYAKEKFVVEPESDGAWLVKNSWGPNWGNNGYFWISYEDLSIIPRVSICGYEDMDDNQKVYNLDETGRNYDYTASQNQQGFINVFEIEENERLESVTFFQSSTTAICQLYYVPINEDGTPDVVSKVALGEPLDIGYSGYHTIQIDEDIVMNEGSKCGIMIYVEDDSKSARIGIEYKCSYTNITISAGESYLCSATNVITDFSTLAGISRGNFSIKLETREVTSINECAVSTISNQTYSGEEIRPSINLTIGDYQLVENIDYVLNYSNNINSGTATITVNGKGNYAGIRELEFTIDRAQMSNVVVTQIEPQGYTGEKLLFVPTVTYNSMELTYGTDFGVAFVNCTNVGTATIVLVGLNNFNGTKTVNYTITNDLSYATIEGVYDYEYNGSYRPFTPVVRIGETILTQNTDYIVSVVPHYNYNNVDTYYYNVIGTNDYMGSTYVTFDILSTDISNTTVSNISNQTYTGSAIRPEATITFNGSTLTKGVDYTLTYSNNVEKGTATITIAGIGNFKGTTTKTFIIY